MIASTGLNAIAQQTGSVTEVTSTAWKANLQEISSKTALQFDSMIRWKSINILVEKVNGMNNATVDGFIVGGAKQVNLDTAPVPLKKDGSFSLQFLFSTREKLFVLTVIDSSGRLHRFDYKLTPGSRFAPLEKTVKLRYSFGFGYTHLTYAQSYLPEFHEKALTLKGGITYRLIPDRLDLGFSGFYNSYATTDGPFIIRYLGLNLRAGYHLSDPASRWRWVLNAGFYYNTSMGTIGFTDMKGPQIYPELSYVMNHGKTLTTYAKFSPVANGFGLDFTTNYEVATGMYFSFPLNLKNRMSIGLDYSRMNLSADDVKVTTSTVSLSAGITF